MIDAVVKGILVGLFMAISVGPTVFVILQYSITYSHKAGFAFVLGVSVSDIMYVTLANVAAPLLNRLMPYERIITIAGGLALMAIGIAGIVKKHVPKRPVREQKPISRGNYLRFWLSGFLVNTLNPGVIVTWLGIVTLTIGTTIAHRVVLFATCLTLILSIDFLKVFLASRIKKLLTMRRIIYLQRISAICLFCIGAFLMIKSFVNVNASAKPDKGIDKVLSCTYTEHQTKYWKPFTRTNATVAPNVPY